MDKDVWKVPKGIKYLSDWQDFKLPDFPCIINKTITGCGFTELAITNKVNVIVGSPRRALLKNKAEQHKDDSGVAYIMSSADLTAQTDIDISKPRTRGEIAKADKDREDKEKQDAEGTLDFKNRVKEHWRSCQTNFAEKRFESIPCKILVTYDSFRKVKEALIEEGVFDQFYVVVDEFQSIFTDSRFKSTTELEFVDQLSDVQKVCYVSATPMIDRYLEQIDDFKDLPFITLDWESEDPSRIVHPSIESFSCTRLIRKVCSIVDKYKSGSFSDKDSFKHLLDDGSVVIEYPKCAVFYFNSVKNICDIIKKTGLTIDDVNVICSDTLENEKKVRKAFKGKARDGIKYIGQVPLPGERWKKFTMCTRTVYLGADFYCDSGMSYIFSDANIECLSVDITIDLPQILGRMRNESNPWKNRAEVYFTPIGKDNKVDKSEFDAIIARKQEATNNLLSIWGKGTGVEKNTLSNKYRRSAKFEIYKEDYVAVNEHAGNDLLPVLNKLVMVSEQRAYDIQQIDYSDRCTVFSTIYQKFGGGLSEFLSDLIEEFNSLTTFYDKTKFLCDAKLSDDDLELVLGRVPLTYGNYFHVLGRERIIQLGYNHIDLERESNNKSVLGILSDAIYQRFSEGDRLDKATIKSELNVVYKSINYNSKPRASDIEKWFDIKESMMTINGKRTHGFKLIKKKF